MKKILNYISAFAIIATMTACSLEEERVSFANRQSCYETVFQMKSVVNSCYMPLKSFMSASYAMGMEAASDLWYDNTSIADAICDLTPTKCGTGTGTWQQCYKGIMYCNEAIECITNATSVPESDRMPFVAECRVLRALYYYYLTCNFCDVPFYTYMVEDMTTLQKIRELPRTSADEIRNFIYEDLKNNAIPYFTKANGYDNRTIDIPGNRAGKPLALMLMAKCKMWNGSPAHSKDEEPKWVDAEGNPTHVCDTLGNSWQEALEPLQELELMYGSLTEANYPLADTWWSVKNTAESIFEVQHEWSIEGIQYSGGACRLMYTSVSEGTMDGIMMPYWGTQMTSHSVCHATKRLAYWRPKSGIKKEADAVPAYTLFPVIPLTYGEYNTNNGRYNAVVDFDAIESGMIRGQKLDRRTYHILGLGDLWGYGEYDTPTPTADDRTFNQVKKNGQPYGGPKFWVPNLVANYDGNNYKIFRYADAILMMAECYCMLGDVDKANSYLNVVRDRAGAPSLTGETKEEVLSIIQDERARELCGEMHRRYDLVRWGIWFEMVNTYNTTGNIVKKGFIKPWHEYYPIPDKQCALSGYLLKNPAYGESSSGEGEEAGSEEQFEDD